MSIVSKVKIANMALANLGTRNSIESLTENSTEAKQANLWYDQSRLLTLEGYDWNFARKRQSLALDNESAPDNIWSFRYAYPSDCVKARKLQQPDHLRNPLLVDNLQTTHNTLAEPDAVPFDIEMDSTGTRKTILTDLEDAILVYTFDQNDVNVLPFYFVQTLSYALAFNMSMALTGRKSIRDDMLATFNGMLAIASEHDANERVDRAPRQASWIRARD